MVHARRLEKEAAQELQPRAMEYDADGEGAGAAGPPLVSVSAAPAASLWGGSSGLDGEGQLVRHGHSPVQPSLPDDGASPAGASL